MPQEETNDMLSSPLCGIKTRKTRKASVTMGLRFHDSHKSKLAYLIQLFHNKNKCLRGGNRNFQLNN